MRDLIRDILGFFLTPLGLAAMATQSLYHRWFNIDEGMAFGLGLLNLPILFLLYLGISHLMGKSIESFTNYRKRIKEEEQLKILIKEARTPEYQAERAAYYEKRRIVWRRQGLLGPHKIKMIPMEKSDD